MLLPCSSQPSAPHPGSLPRLCCSAKACWLAGNYADIEFGDGQGRGPTFSALLQRVVAAIGGEPPARRALPRCALV